MHKLVALQLCISGLTMACTGYHLDTLWSLLGKAVSVPESAEHDGLVYACLLVYVQDEVLCMCAHRGDLVSMVWFWL